MEDNLIINESKSKISRNLKNLYLDPNNYRFVDHKDYKKVPPEMVTDERIQRRTRTFIEGEKLEKIKDLIESFKANGFLKVDVIQAMDMGSNVYLVIEGNRRIAALKYLQDQYRQGISIGKLDPSIFGSIPFEIHEKQDTENHLIIMGLKHISGNKKWAAINQAQLIYDYLVEYKTDKNIYAQKETELCSSLGISKQKLRLSQRAYHLIQEYKNSDFGDQFTSDMYSIFEEIVKRPELREWLGWNDDDYKSNNFTNLERLFSWISKVEETEDEQDEKAEEGIIREPIITKAFEIRDLATIIRNEDALLVLEDKKSIGRALQVSGIEERNTIDKSINTVKDNLKSIRRFTDVFEISDVEELEKISKEINELLPRKAKLGIQNTSYSNCFQLGEVKHFTELVINKYKLFSNFKITNLNRINIIAGTNNCGKTTLLEIVYLLCNQNDVGSLFSLTKARAKVNEIDPVYIREILEPESSISGIFYDYPVSLEIQNYEDSGVEKLNDYISSVKMIGKIDTKLNQTAVHMYEYNPMKREFTHIEHICNIFFSSPYMFDIDKLISIYNRTLEKVNGVTPYDEVISFIKRIDPTINKILYTEDNGIKKFVVDSSRFEDRNVDLTSYGEGLFRIFELALSFASCRNGVLLIDEFETAIHYSLLKHFTKFVQELAVKFNVQVFLTTHSKECIDAFVNNQYKNEDISAYLIYNKENQISSKHINGIELYDLVESIDLDIRGGDSNEN